jgi:hypothetical protein
MATKNNSTLKILEHDAITNETIVREFNSDEIAQYELEKNLLLQAKAEAEAKAAARQAIADRLGLTADELQVLLG